jgi:serine/threonine protein kinase
LQARNQVLLPEDDILFLFVQMVKAIQVIHSHNILHRDLKTQNIMLDSQCTFFPPECFARPFHGASAESFGLPLGGVW